MKIINANHYTEEQEEIIRDMFNYASAKADECKRIYFDGSIPKQDKYDMIKYKTTEISAILNMIAQKFKYEVRDDKGELMSQEIFSRAYYYEVLAKIS